ncbi:MAG: hypothetical protein HRU20_03940 [Pseudomonadales bacterium]|nr:hypothetical protein [Pseudomonadales bacterium]
MQNNTDCNDSVDTGTAINPSATDVNDQIDNNCDGTVNDAPFALGDYGQAGGTVFYIINDGLNGLEASPEDQDKGSGAEWGCFSTDVPGAAGQEIGDGEKNTADILAAKCTPENIDNHLAAELADNYSLNGYNDWFLPSKGEMNALYAQKSIIPNLTLACYYWSSNKDITIYAQGLCLQSGVWNGSGRSSTHRVRAIRAF